MPSSWPPFFFYIGESWMGPGWAPVGPQMSSGWAPVGLRMGLLFPDSGEGRCYSVANVVDGAGFQPTLVNIFTPMCNVMRERVVVNGNTPGHSLGVESELRSAT